MGAERTSGRRREEGQQAVGQRILLHNHRNQGVLVLARTLVHILAVGRILGRILVRTVKNIGFSVDEREIRIANLMRHVLCDLISGQTVRIEMLRKRIQEGAVECSP